MITAGIIYAVIFLPFTVPDESEHYLSAYRISNYITFNSDQFSDERLLIRSADLELFGKLRSSELTPEYYSLLAKNFRMFAQDKSASFIPAPSADGITIGYIAPAIGISLGRFFRLGALPTFYLGRFANLAVYVLLVWLAIKRIPYGKTALFAISALPTGIHLVSSYSCDALIIALAMLFIAEALYIRESPDRIKLRNYTVRRSRRAAGRVKAYLLPDTACRFPDSLRKVRTSREKGLLRQGRRHRHRRRTAASYSDGQHHDAGAGRRSFRSNERSVFAVTRVVSPD